MRGLWRYREALIELGLEQLDVYEHKTFDVLRVKRISDGRVMRIRLPRHRKDLSIDEFKTIVRREINRYEKRKNV